MTKAEEYCKSHPYVGSVFESAHSGFHIHGFEYGDTDRAYVSYVCGSKSSYHLVKIQQNRNGYYVEVCGCKHYLDDFIRAV